MDHLYAGLVPGRETENSVTFLFTSQTFAVFRKKSETRGKFNSRYSMLIIKVTQVYSYIILTTLLFGRELHKVQGTVSVIDYDNEKQVTIK